MRKEDLSSLEALRRGDSRWALLTGDSCTLLRYLNLGEVDHVVTDPPYSAGVYQRGGVRSGNSNPGTSSWRSQKNGRSRGAQLRKFDFHYTALDSTVQRLVAHQLGRVVKRWALVFTDADHGVAGWIDSLEACGGLEHVRTGAWIKTNAQPQFSGDRPSMGFEAIVIAHQVERFGACRWNGGGKAALWPFALSGDRQPATRWHPTPKPIDLIVQLVLDFTDKDDLILDPFAGSAAIGAACLRTGRRYLGFELNPTWASKARRMLANEAIHEVGVDRRQAALFGSIA